MAAATPEIVRIDAADTQLSAVHWHGPADAPVVFAVHGLTANAWSWSTVARQLDGEIGLVSIDLRGRGGSEGAPGPFGIRRHADDLARAVEQLGTAPAVIVGHSMGAFVALSCVERHPSTASHLVLVDGGTAIDVPAGLEADEALDVMLGPSLDRLRTVWPDRVSYRAMWADHPAFADQLTPEVERYVLSDLIPCDGGFRSSVSEEAVRVDGAQLLADPDLRTLLERRRGPTTIVRATLGLMAAPPPLIAETTMERFPRHDWRTVAGTNHYDVLIGDTGARAVARAILDAI